MRFNDYDNNINLFNIDEVNVFFNNMDDGIKNLVDIPASLFSYISNFINGLIQHGNGSGSNPYIHISPGLMRKCMDIERRSVDEEHKTVKTKARVVTKITTITQRENTQPETKVSVNEENIDYEMNVYDAKYPYRLWWQLTASMSAYMGLEGAELNSFLQTVQQYLMPQFIWSKTGKCTRDVTEYTRKTRQLLQNEGGIQVRSGSIITITEKTT